MNDIKTVYLHRDNMLDDDEIEEYVNAAYSEQLIQACENQILAILKSRYEKYPTEINNATWLDYTNFICRRRHQGQ